MPTRSGGRLPPVFTTTDRADATTLTVDRITSIDDVARLEQEWTALEIAAGNALPFRTAAWTLAWWCHLRRRGAAIRDSLALRTIRSADGTLVGVAPLMLTERPAFSPIRTRCLQFIGADPNITELPGPLWARGYEAACIDALAANVAAHATRWDWMTWSGVPQDATAAGIEGKVTWRRATPHYTLTLDGDWPAFKSKLTRNVKESLRKCYNSLKRDGLKHSLTVLSDWADIRQALPAFFHLHSQRAGAPGMVRHRDVFPGGPSRTFLSDVVRRFAETGRMRLFELHVGDRLVASRLGFVCDRSLYLYYSGYDPAYAKYSVMTTLVAEVIQHALDAGITSIDLSSGNDVSKTRWSPREDVERCGVMRSPRPMGRFAQLVYDAVDTRLQSWDLRHQTVALLSRTHVADRTPLLFLALTIDPSYFA